MLMSHISAVTKIGPNTITTIEYHYNKVLNAIWEAREAGFIVEVELVPKKPLAMCNYDQCLVIREAR